MNIALRAWHNPVECPSLTGRLSAEGVLTDSSRPTALRGLKIYDLLKYVSEVNLTDYMIMIMNKKSFDSCPRSERPRAGIRKQWESTWKAYDQAYVKRGADEGHRKDPALQMPDLRGRIVICSRHAHD